MRDENLLRFMLGLYSSMIKSKHCFQFGYLILILATISIFHSNCLHHPENEKVFTSDEILSASEVLSESVILMENLNSFHFKSTGSIKESFLANNLPKMPNVINYSVHHNNADKHR